MALIIIQNTPVWVWGLLAGLVALGLVQSRDRTVTLMRLTLLPMVLAVLSLSGVLNAFGHQPIALGGWAAGLGTALTLGRHWLSVRGAAWIEEKGMLHVPGSWLPMVLILGLFAIKYGAGVTLAMEPSMAKHAVFAGLCSLAYGSFSGLFLARALSLRALVTRSQAMQAA